MPHTDRPSEPAKADDLTPSMFIEWATEFNLIEWYVDEDGDMVFGPPDCGHDEDDAPQPLAAPVHLGRHRMPSKAGRMAHRVAVGALPVAASLSVFGAIRLGTVATAETVTYVTAGGDTIDIRGGYAHVHEAPRPAPTTPTKSLPASAYIAPLVATVAKSEPVPNRVPNDLLRKPKHASVCCSVMPEHPKPRSNEFHRFSEKSKVKKSKAHKPKVERPKKELPVTAKVPVVVSVGHKPPHPAPAPVEVPKPPVVDVAPVEEPVVAAPVVPPEAAKVAHPETPPEVAAA